jgi:hypothetical protein
LLLREDKKRRKKRSFIVHMLVEEAHEGAVVREVRGGLVPVQLFMDSQDIATSVSTPEPLYVSC